MQIVDWLDLLDTLYIIITNIHYAHRCIFALKLDSIQQLDSNNNCVSDGGATSGPDGRVEGLDAAGDTNLPHHWG